MDESRSTINMPPTLIGEVRSFIPVTFTSEATLTLEPFQCKGNVIVTNATTTLTLPVVANGMFITVYSLTSTAVTIDPNDNDCFVLDGVIKTDGKYLLSEGLAGNMVSLAGVEDAGGWIVTGRSGDWSVEA